MSRAAKPTTGHGGAREGSGRKPLAPGVLMVVCTVRLTPAQKRKFLKLGGAVWLREQLR